MNSAELRERLRALPETRTVENQTREDVILTRAQFAQLVRERSEAAAALARLEALENRAIVAEKALFRAELAIERIRSDVEHRIRDSGLFTPAGQKGGEDG